MSRVLSRLRWTGTESDSCAGTTVTLKSRRARHAAAFKLYALIIIFLLGILILPGFVNRCFLTLGVLSGSAQQVFKFVKALGIHQAGARGHGVLSPQCVKNRVY